MFFPLAPADIIDGLFQNDLPNGNSEHNLVAYWRPLAPQMSALTNSAVFNF